MRASAACALVAPFVLVASSCSGGGSHGHGGNAGTGGGGATPSSSTILHGPPGALSVWTLGAGTKVQPTTAAGAATSVSLATCRMASASAQVVVHGSGGYVKGVTVALAGDLSDGSGHALGKANVTFYRPAFIDFTSISANNGNVPVPAKSPTHDGRIPDALIPLVNPYTSANAGQPFDVDQDTNLPVFLDVVVPKGTAPGTYTGTIQVAADGGLSATVPISVTVWDLDLPDMRSVTTHFKMSTNDLYQYHHGTSKCSGGSCYLDWNAQSKTIVKRYQELMHAHRVDVGQEFVVVPQNGCAAPSASDWAAYDTAMAPYMDGSYYADGVPSGRFDIPFQPGQNFGPESACDQAGYIALAKEWSKHLKGKGWFNQAIVYAYDEPPTSALPGIAKNAAWLEQADPDYKARILDTTAPSPSNIGVLGPAIGIFVVVPEEYDTWNAGNYYGRKDWPTLFAENTALWFYVGNSVLPPAPTFGTNTLDGLEPVMLMWGSWYEHATGFLYWDTAAWDAKDPWGPEITWGLTGDGVLIYPGNHDGDSAPAGSPADVAIDGPVPSYRLKMVRKGLEDWALFRLADSKGLTSLVQQQVATVYGQFCGCTYSGCPTPQAGFYWKTDEAAMDAIRETVVKAVIKAP